MRLRILGCHGGESPSHRATSFLVDDNILLDAGALTRGLTVPQQALIDYVLLSHVHLDHIRDLALLTDNVIGVRKSPVEVFATDFTADALEKHFFNNLIWPDFTKIPNPADPNKGPTLKITRYNSGDTLEVGGYTVTTVPVNHPVDCQAIFVTGKTGTLVYSGDTGPTEALWTAINALKDLRAFIYEVSFPNNMEKLAHISGHLTPQMMAEELKKFKPQSKAPVLLYHMKPGFHEVLKDQVAALNDARLTILKPMDEFEL
ncbi:MAG TPA: 3',5'-cyclic-nucleotide phosphodiesterase [Myxococcota bacterium]|nr:3',5'-cyclic-nucleotide phosphodiesterase [Myxococcota bacterium]